MTYTRKDVDILKKQLEDLAKEKKAKIVENGYFDNDSVNIVYKSICERVSLTNK